MPDDLRDQFPIVRELLEAFRIPIYQLEGFEADDLIGTLTRQAEDARLETMIVSGDLDMLQLVSDQTTLMTTRGGVQQTVIYDPSQVMERYGLRPEQMIDFKALKGDTTDNIPGIAGVGEKTAAKLVQDWTSLDGIYEHIDAGPAREAAHQARGEPRRRLPLARPGDRRPDVPVELDLEPARLGDYDRDEVLRLFREYEFRSLVERLPGVTGEEARAPGDLLPPGRPERPDPRGAGRRAEPSAAQRAAAGVGGGGGMQLSLDLEHRRRRPTATVPAQANGHRPPRTERPQSTLCAGSRVGSARERLTALAERPVARSRFADAEDVAAWLAQQTGADHRRRADGSASAARRRCSALPWSTRPAGR